MRMLHELRPAGMMALQLPRALRPRRCDGIRYVAERNAHYPVLLVHGYAATGAVWTPLRRGPAGGQLGPAGARPAGPGPLAGLLFRRRPGGPGGIRAAR